MVVVVVVVVPGVVVVVVVVSPSSTRLYTKVNTFSAAFSLSLPIRLYACG